MAPEPIPLRDDGQASPWTPAPDDDDNPMRQKLFSSFSEEEIENILSVDSGHRVLDSRRSGASMKLEDLTDMTPYDIAQELQQESWSKEASRLFEAMFGDLPLLYRPQGDSNTLLSLDSRCGYDSVSHYAERAWDVINAIIHDSQITLAAHSKGLCNRDILLRSRRHLESMVSPGQQDGSAHHDCALMGSQCHDYDGIIDHCTAVLGRVMIDAGYGSFSTELFMSNLAKVSAKLKILPKHPRDFARLSLDRGHDVGIPAESDFRPHGNNTAESENTPYEEGALLPYLRELHGELMSIGGQQAEAIQRRHYAEVARYQYIILELLRIMLSPFFRGPCEEKALQNPYEISAVVYAVGFNRVPTLVFQDLGLGYSGSSNAATVRYAKQPIMVLRHTLHGIHQRNIARESNIGTHNLDEPMPTPAVSSEVPKSHHPSLGTEMRFDFREYCYIAFHQLHNTSREPRRIRLESMYDVVSVMAPLMLTKPASVCAIGEFTKSVTGIKNYMRRLPVEDPLDFTRYRASVQLTTFNGNEDDIEVLLSRSYLSRLKLFSGKTITEIGGHSQLSPATGIRHFWRPRLSDSSSLAAFRTLDEVCNRAIRNEEKMEVVNFTMSSWIFEEKVVVVRCKTYVTLLMLSGALLIIAGLAVGLTVGERIPGVDPFNLTSFSWILAAFVILIGKSIRVKSWTWNDFVHGRVQCTSVSELSSVTGLNKQLILVKLLEIDSLSLLQTRGPYNALFRRSSDEGFSIDVPMGMWALVCSGQVLLTVLTTNRKLAVVCLDLRQGTMFNAVPASCGGGENQCSPAGERLFCIDMYSALSPYGAYGWLFGDPKEVRLRKGRLDWTAVGGMVSDTETQLG